MRTVEEHPFEYPFTCETCKSQYVAEADDIKFGRFGGIGYAGEPGTPKFYVNCPSTTCGQINFIDNKMVPPNVQKLAQAKYQW